MKKPDFYAIQIAVDGFGNDTATLACFRTENEALAYFKKQRSRFEEDEIKIVPQYWGEYKDYFG